MKRKKLIIILIISMILVLSAGTRWLIVSRHTLQFWHLPLSGRVIVVDAGHGGPDGGAVGGDTVEKALNLAIARNLRDYLQESGALVVMTRDSDEDLADEDYTGRHKTQDLLRRADLIEKAHPDAVISVHMNAIPSTRWHGAQTFFYPKSVENERFARLIQDAIRKTLNNTDRYAKPIGHVYILKKASPPAALVEVGFLSNPDERSMLVKESYQKKVAAAISVGILRYFTSEKAPSN
ncbi:N-acetylmuramoyl-L-alanine amidase CwlD [Sporolactobacillus vineae]|uniref:N-acetylmuramoyl-L-alanine amidase CwlD n=1 Tax=Sporolactobacillus vineae TaxID=444463 RepID=UPI00028A1788|nr:N-acetylmuramoyl-L-alanine amidase CwlD [Sporolactobacillus vineae]